MPPYSSNNLNGPYPDILGQQKFGPASAVYADAQTDRFIPATSKNWEIIRTSNETENYRVVRYDNEGNLKQEFVLSAQQLHDLVLAINNTLGNSESFKVGYHQHNGLL